jgi:hypothetical protein
MPGWKKAGKEAYHATAQKSDGACYRLTVEKTEEKDPQWEWIAWRAGWSCQGYAGCAIDAMKAAEWAIGSPPMQL